MSHSTDMKRLFRSVCQMMGLTFAVKCARFGAIPATTLYTLAQDHTPLPHVGAYKRRGGGGRMSAYSRTELQQVFDQVDELRHIKKVSPMEFSKITLDLLGPRQLVHDTCKKNHFGLQQLTPSDSNAKSAFHRKSIWSAAPSSWRTSTAGVTTFDATSAVAVIFRSPFRSSLG